MDTHLQHLVYLLVVKYTKLNSVGRFEFECVSNFLIKFIHLYVFGQIRVSTLLFSRNIMVSSVSCKVQYAVVSWLYITS